MTAEVCSRLVWRFSRGFDGFVHSWASGSSHYLKGDVADALTTLEYAPELLEGPSFRALA